MVETRRRAAILTVASRLFAEKGYVNTTTSEIAQEAGVAEGTLYHHFGSKDGIFLTIFDEMADGYLEAAESLVREGGSGAETLRALIRFHFDFLRSNAARFLVILRDFPSHLAAGDSGRAADSRRKFGRLTVLLSEILSRGAADGSLRLLYPPVDTAGMMRGVLYGTTRHQMLGIIDIPLPRLATMVEGFCLEALSPLSGGQEILGEGGR